MQNYFMHVSHETFIDPPNYPGHNLPRSFRPSPVIFHIEIIHAEYTLLIPDDDVDVDSHSIIIREPVASQCFWSGIGFLMRNEESRLNVFSAEFASLGIALPYHRGIANRISQEIMTSSPHIFESDEERIVQVVVLVRTIMFNPNYIERVFNRIIGESIDEYETSMNYGMVPAATESLAMVKNSVKVEEKSSCTICLDDLDEFASAMPCKHMFHNECIFTWLKQSHYCPICRFELPTDHVAKD